MLLLRLCFGILIISQHGMPKLMKFAAIAPTFYDPMGIGGKWSLVMVLFAEVFCGMFIVLGLFTRLAVIPLIILMLVAFFGRHNGIVGEGEASLLYLTAYLVLLFCGPGRVSVDGMIKK
jgi:putative oxidoreductase